MTRAYPKPTNPTIPWMTDRLVSRGIKGTGPRKRNAVAIAALPHIEIIVGYLNLSQILNTKMHLKQYFVAVKDNLLRIKSWILVVYDVWDEMNNLLEDRKSIVTLRRFESILRTRKMYLIYCTITVHLCMSLLE